MLLMHEGRRLYYDLTGDETAPVVCFTHSLASDSGMWAEQMPPLLAAGYLRHRPWPAASNLSCSAIRRL